MARTEEKSAAFDRLREGATRLLAARSGAEELDGAEKQKILARLETATWEVLAEVVGAAVADEMRDDLPFTDRDRRALDYGFFELGLDEAEESIGRAVEAARAERADRIEFVTDALRRQYRVFLRIDEGRALFARQKDLEETISLAALRLASLRRTRDRILGWVAGADVLPPLRSLLAEIDAELERYLRLERKTNTGQLKDPALRREYVETKIRMVQRVDQRDRLVGALSGGAKILDLNRRIAAVYGDLFAAEEDRTANREAIEVFQEEVRSCSPRQARAELVEELKSIRLFAKMGAQRAGAQPRTMPTGGVGDAGLATPSRVAVALEHIVAFDPYLWDNQQTRREGKPTILLVPGTGNGIYDWNRNRIILPTVPHRSLEESLAYALATYRDDVDSQTSDRAALKSYASLKVNSGIRSTMKMKDLMARDYIAWMTKESQGMSGLAAENRQWIEERIAPRPEEPIPSRTLVELSAADRRRLVRRLGDREDLEPDEFYHRGALRFSDEDYAAAAADFEKALAARPDWPAALYSLGVSLKRAGRASWRDRMTEFLRTAPQSWWSKKAQRMLAR